VSATRWDVRDSGSAFGQLQRVASNATFVKMQRAYRAWLAHTTACEGCLPVDARCPVAADLWQAYQDAIR